MTDKQIVNNIKEHVEARISILSCGGVFQKKGLAELFKLRTLLNPEPPTAAEQAKVVETLHKAPVGDAPLEPVDLKQRSKEIYEKQVAAGLNPEWPEGADKAPPKPAPKKVVPSKEDPKKTEAAKE